MNWLPGVVTGVGLLVNVVWTAVNMQMRSDLKAQISDLKEQLRAEYVSTEVCKLRMGL